MALITYPLDDSPYDAEDAELFHCTRTSGIWVKDNFAINNIGNNKITIGKGIAWINNKEFSGKVAALKVPETIDMGIADGTYPRIDVIAIRFSVNDNATTIFLKKGTAKTNPVRPAITRTGDIYELYIASILRPAGSTSIATANITDLRLDSSVCGLMADSVTKIDTDLINSQVIDLINVLQKEIIDVKDTSGLMFLSDWTSGGVVKVSKGGTGATTPISALKNLGGIGMDLIWINASQSSNFAAQQISINLVKYIGVMIVVKNGTTAPMEESLVVPRAKLGSTHRLSIPGAVTAFRNFKVWSDGSRIEFEDGKEITTYGGSSVVANNRAIPLEIYGIVGEVE